MQIVLACIEPSFKVYSIWTTCILVRAISQLLFNKSTLIRTWIFWIFLSYSSVDISGSELWTTLANLKTEYSSLYFDLNRKSKIFQNLYFQIAVSSRKFTIRNEIHCIVIWTNSWCYTPFQEGGSWQIEVPRLIYNL